MSLFIALAITMVMNLGVMMYTKSVAESYPLDKSESIESPELLCALYAKDLREIALSNPDAFDVQNFEYIGAYRYMCTQEHWGDSYNIDWDWIEHGAELKALCLKYKSECGEK